MRLYCALEFGQQEPPFDAGIEGLKQEEKRYAAAQEEKK